jgi:hypothetical protein
MLLTTYNIFVLGSIVNKWNIVYPIKRRRAKWIGHILRRNCLLKHVIEGNLEGRREMTGRRGRRRKQLLDDLKENRRYWKFKEELALEEATDLS